jgi:hypothetical protein
LLDKSEKQISVLTKRDFSFVGGLISKDSVLGQLMIINQLIFKSIFNLLLSCLKAKLLKHGLFDESQNEEGNYFMRIKVYKCALLNEQVLYDQGKNGFGQSGLSSNLYEMEKGELLNLKFAYDHDYISSTKYRVAVQ